MDKKDYYELLGVSKSATKEDLKKAYRAQARKLHPDVNPGDSEAESKFKEVSEAYQVLNDDQKRSVYDRYGHAGLSGGGGGADDFGFGGFSDIFDAFFGGGTRSRSRPRGPARGADLRYDLEISLHDAAFGTEVNLDLPVHVECDNCGGTGSASKAFSTACQKCRGTGEVRQVRQSMLGQVVNVTTCPDCRGRGQVVKDPCRKCGATGMMRGEKKVKVTVPAGVDTGQQLRLMGEGEMGELGGPRGDLYVVMFVREHEFFKREGQDIICELPISITQAALGDDVEVPTLFGMEKLQIPAGTQTGMVFRLRERGLPHIRGRHKGDQHVLVKVMTPTKLNTKQKRLLKEFAAESGDTIHRPQKNFFEKIKDVLKTE